MIKPLLNKATEIQLSSIIAKPPQSLIISGISGIGKFYIARYIAKNYFKTNNQYYSSVLEITSDIYQPYGVECIKDIIHFINNKHQKYDKLSKIVIIKDIQDLSIDAQNQLLKPLEEPPESTMFILTVDDKTKVLPTIISRCVDFCIEIPTISATYSYYNDKFEKLQIEKAYNIAGGLPGVIHSIMNNTNHPLLKQLEMAKYVVSNDAYTLLGNQNIINLTKDELRTICQLLQQMSHLAIINPKTTNPKKWHKILSATYSAESLLDQNVNTKLVLTQLTMNI
jgi:DNA polymerase III delta prime subunit